MAIDEAPISGAQTRFRAVMMTSIAFILGLLPLVIATGAAEISRRAVGTAVFGGMLAASSIGIFLVPMLYVTFQRLRERVKANFGVGRKKLKARTMDGQCLLNAPPRVFARWCRLLRGV